MIFGSFAIVQGHRILLCSRLLASSHPLCFFRLRGSDRAQRTPSKRTGGRAWSAHVRGPAKQSELCRSSSSFRVDENGLLTEGRPKRHDVLYFPTPESSGSNARSISTSKQPSLCFTTSRPTNLFRSWHRVQEQPPMALFEARDPSPYHDRPYEYLDYLGELFFFPSRSWTDC